MSVSVITDNTEIRFMSINVRDQTIDCELSDERLTLTVRNSFNEFYGRVVFDNADAQHLRAALTLFFTEDLYQFLPERKSFVVDDIGNLKLISTTWGEPLERGVTLMFSDDFEDYSYQNFEFSLQAAGVRSLINLLSTN